MAKSDDDGKPVFLHPANAGYDPGSGAIPPSLRRTMVLILGAIAGLAVVLGTTVGLASHKWPITMVMALLPIVVLGPVALYASRDRRGTVVLGVCEGSKPVTVTSSYQDSNGKSHTTRRAGTEYAFVFDSPTTGARIEGSQAETSPSTRAPRANDRVAIWYRSDTKYELL